MKKNYWSLFVCLAMLSSVFTLTSCSKEDEVGSSGDIIGTWQLVSEKGYYIENGSKETWEYGPETAEFSKIIFTRSTVTIYEDDSYYNQNSDYEFDGNKLIFSPDDSPEIFKVTKLTASALVFEYSEKEGEDEYYAKFTFKRVN